MTVEEREFLVEFIFQSDAIEGIKDDKNLIRRELEGGKPDGHVGTFLLLQKMVLEHSCLLDEAVICRVQGLITAEQHLKPGCLELDPRHIGRYRDIWVKVGERLCPSPLNVQPAMQRFVKKIRRWQSACVVNTEDENIKEIADSHFNFEHIHPFADGNGRTGRAIVYYLLRYARHTPFIFTSEDKHSTYYPCFKNRALMKSYFLKKMGLI